MSIPVSIDPLGTLGGRPSGYVTRNLVYWLDCAAERDGTVTHLTEWVSGRRIELTSTTGVVISDGVAQGSFSIPYGDFERRADYAVELVASSLETGTVTVGAWNIYHNDTYNTNIYSLGLRDKLVMCGMSRNLSYVNHYRYVLPNDKVGRLITVTADEMNAVPKIDGNVLTLTSDQGIGSSNLCYSSGVFSALRIYSAPLTDAEKALNLARDAERWDKTKNWI